ncbi:tetratricopeptide repeat protein [Martelella lutilitoris]|uniref:Tetratricopeptide repeat protein n=1 Tax=Martelella lutilitoris TaxID=2583532 RepID=A0A7T7HHY2_9HYPH|nr:tetratricopeptide repeat protein [Martelella lutilitoris]QQM29514.1 tetratricopeptide repeat protein [Martelella lutilitoris]
MPAGIREALEKQVTEGKDNALCRLTLGRILAGEDRLDEAIAHLTRALELDPDYSAAYSALGKAYQRNGEKARAIETFGKGADVATRKGDLQAARQMQVLHRKLNKG